MGSLCCCPSQEDFEEYASYPNGSVYQHCFCLRCCIRNILSMYSTVFYRVDGHSGMPPSSASASAGLLAITSPDTSPPDTFRPPPRPLPYDVDPRYVCMQRDGLIRRDKTSGYSHEDSDSHIRDNDTVGETITMLQSKYYTESSEKHLSAKTLMKLEPPVVLVEDEDVCPTCLDDYTSENPKISTQCGHHFHLGCIYEWMERSESCPVCGKEMIFNESP